MPTELPGRVMAPHRFGENIQLAVLGLPSDLTRPYAHQASCPIATAGVADGADSSSELGAESVFRVLQVCACLRVRVDYRLALLFVSGRHTNTPQG